MDPVCGSFGAHRGPETVEICHVWRINVGCGLWGGEGKTWIGCLHDILKAFGFNADLWTTVTRDRGGWRKTAGKGQNVHGIIDRCRESQSWTQRHAVVCLNVTGRTKDKDSSKQACSCWFASHCSLAISGANLYPQSTLFVDDMPLFSGVAFFSVLFCFVFIVFPFIEFVTLCSVALRFACVPAVIRNELTTVCVFYCFVSLFRWRCALSEYCIVTNCRINF